MWNETATGKGEKSGYPWKAFLFDQFQISVLSIMCVKNVFAVFFLQFSLKKKSDRSLRRTLVVVFHTVIMYLTPYHIIYQNYSE